MGFFSAIKKMFGGGEPSKETGKEIPSERPSAPSEQPSDVTLETDSRTSIQASVPDLSTSAAATPLPAAQPTDAKDDSDADLTLRLREAEPRLSAWLAVILEDVEEAGELLWRRLLLLLRSLDAPQDEAQAFVDEFRDWLERMEYRQVEEFRSELQYRLALALDLEDEEDERSRLFVKISNGLSRTREQFTRGLEALFAGHGELDDAFWEEMEELFIMADLGYEAALELVERLKERARKEKVTETVGVRKLLMDEVEEIFRVPRHIVAVNPPEVILMIGVNGVGKTTTIAKLAHRDRMQGKKVMIAAADTFRAAAIEQLQVWAERAGALFHARAAGSDPASVAYEAMDRAVRERVDVLYVDTAGRLQTKVNLMEELSKIRHVLGKKHEGAPHRSVLVIDATTGQNALSQTRLFKEAAGVDELILTKLDGTAKGGVAIAVAMQYHLPITYVGLGEKMEDLRPFDGGDYARALLGQNSQSEA
ncbi:MAG: signal recognition particle-docking protein FtsY [Desulfovibrio sp.]|nr:signal recognition particle-docking protein FtsY [Desulfovibrio sp.]